MRIIVYIIAFICIMREMGNLSKGTIRDEQREDTERSRENDKE